MNTWTKDLIKAHLIDDKNFLERAIVVLFDRQTEIEKEAHVTIQRNGKGYSKFDAPFLSSLARQIKFGGSSLTVKQRAAGLKMMIKYSGQLAEYANSRQVLDQNQLISEPPQETLGSWQKVSHNHYRICVGQIYTDDRGFTHTPFGFLELSQNGQPQHEVDGKLICADFVDGFGRHYRIWADGY